MSLENGRRWYSIEPLMNYSRPLFCEIAALSFATPISGHSLLVPAARLLRCCGIYFRNRYMASFSISSGTNLTNNLLGSGIPKP